MDGLEEGATISGVKMTGAFSGPQPLTHSELAPISQTLLGDCSERTVKPDPQTQFPSYECTPSPLSIPALRKSWDGGWQGDRSLEDKHLRDAVTGVVLVS